MSTCFRPARPDDIPTLVDIECRAFGRDTPEARLHKQRELEHELGLYVVLEAEGRPVATARILRHWLQVGCCRVLKGDVGHVAVLPEEQGRGHGTTLMQTLVPYLRQQGFHLSRLGGLMHFYSRFGYEPFLRRYVHLPLQPAETDLKGRRWRDLIANPPALAACLHPYDPSLHAAAVHALRLRTERGRCGQFVLDETPPPPVGTRASPEALDWVYAEGDQVRGFLHGSYALVNAGDAAPSYRLDELLVDADCPQAAGVLVKALLARAIAIAPTVVSCRLPYDEGLFSALTAAGIAYEVSEWRQANDGNMMLVADAAGTLAAVAPELTVRLQSAGLPLWQGVVRFALAGQEAWLRIGETVEAPLSVEAQATVACSQAEFIMFVLGICGFGELRSPGAGLTPAQRLTLGVLFPRRPCASGPWG